MKDRESGFLMRQAVKEGKMENFSVLTGDKAGLGIDKAMLILDQ